MTRFSIYASVILALGLLGFWFLRPDMPPPDQPDLSTPVLTPVQFDELPGWAAHDPTDALDFLHSHCPSLTNRSTGPLSASGEWRSLCAALAANTGPARAFIEAHFRPWSVAGNGEGLFTGYYEPELRGSRSAHGPYQTPIFRKPPDLVEWELNDFATRSGLDPNLPIRRLAGRVENGRLTPYPSRAEIVAGALDGRDLELLWVDDPVDAFFLQIQGSGRVVLDSGETVRVGYDGQNGRPYRAIGRDLIAHNQIAPEGLSMQSIRAWLSSHPEQATEIMNLNPSFVFFRENTRLAADQGPLGAAGLPLVPERSLAIDPRFWPYGLPVWLDTTVPGRDGPMEPYQRLMIASDTGGAIKGPVRGDIFFGTGDQAARMAGPMQQPGRIYILLPRELRLDARPFQVSKR